MIIKFIRNPDKVGRFPAASWTWWSAAASFHFYTQKHFFFPPSEPNCFSWWRRKTTRNQTLTLAELLISALQHRRCDVTAVVRKTTGTTWENIFSEGGTLFFLWTITLISQFLLFSPWKITVFSYNSSLNSIFWLQSQNSDLFIFRTLVLIS